MSRATIHTETKRTWAPTNSTAQTDPPFVTRKHLPGDSEVKLTAAFASAKVTRLSERRKSRKFCMIHAAKSNTFAKLLE